jgi:NADH-quinone oxidoreductase subunit J
MEFAFTVIAALIVAASIAVFRLRQLVHCALALILTFSGLSTLYLFLNAEFLAWAQILVYVGAVAILIVFALLLTRGSDTHHEKPFSPFWGIGIGISALVWLALIAAILNSTRHSAPSALQPTEVTVKKIGQQLMSDFIIPLEVIGLLLTAALVGAIVIAMTDKSRTAPKEHHIDS